MYHFNSLLPGIGIVLWGTTILLSCNHPHATRMDEPAIHGLGADIHQSNNKGTTALHVAAERGHEAVVLTILKQIQKADKLELIQQRNNYGTNALHVAAERGHEAVIRTFLNQIPEADKVVLIQQSNNK